MANKNIEGNAIKPLHVPAKYKPEAPDEERTVYALADLGRGTAAQVTAKLKQLGDNAATEKRTDKILTELFDNGLVNGSDDESNRAYDLAKVTRPHQGKVDPDSLK